MYTPGDHLYFAGAFHVPSLYHHGIYVGDDQVVHFYGTSKKYDCQVRLIRVREFERLAAHEKQAVKVLHTQRRLSRTETQERALSQLGKSGYNLITNNCEHFANWCVQGVRYSPQVDYQFKQVPRDVRATLRLKSVNGKLEYVEVL